MPHPLALLIIGIASLVPTTLIAGFWSLAGVLMMFDTLKRGHYAGFNVALPVAMAAGWFGLITAWRIYYHLRRKSLAFDHRIAWWGLASGALVAIYLIATSGGSLLFRLGLFGLPLWAAAFFGAVLWRARGQGSEANGAPPSPLA